MSREAGSREPYTLPLSETFELKSAQTGEVYQISVALPVSYAAGEQRYPVLYVLDGSITFATAAELARLVALTGEVREASVVGVGYPGFDLDEFTRRRMHDFTPPGEWDFSGPRGDKLKEGFDEMGGVAPTGGAPAFLKFLTDELQPAIAADYRIERDDIALFGDSAGGAFVMFTVLTDPAAFGKYVCGSPALSIVGDALFRLEERYAGEHQSLPVKLLLCAGLAELDNDAMAAFSIVGNTARMYELLKLRKYAGLELDYYFSPGDDHGAAGFENLSRGLRFLWPSKRGWSWRGE